MKFLTKTVIAAALSSIAFAASAMTPIADNELSMVSGQDGVSIAANLNVNIGSFVYSDTNGAEAGGSVSFNNIAITGSIAATLDILSGTKFFQSAGATGPFTGEAITTLGLNVAGSDPLALQAFYPVGATGTGTDVVRIAIPNLASTKLLNISVASITMGGSTATSSATGSTQSFGSFAMNNINMAGTTAYIWAH